MSWFWRFFAYPILFYPVELLREAFAPSPVHPAGWSLEYEWLAHLRWRLVFSVALLMVFVAGLSAQTPADVALRWGVGYVFLGIVFTGISALYAIVRLLEQIEEETNEDTSQA